MLVGWGERGVSSDWGRGVYGRRCSYGDKYKTTGKKNNNVESGGGAGGLSLSAPTPGRGLKVRGEGSVQGCDAAFSAGGC